MDRKAAETGTPFITWYSPQEYHCTAQMWSFAQDDRGILYVGCGAGVVEYDGASWRLIPTPHGAIARSLVKGPGGRIFVGEIGDFGYLAADAHGEMKFRSLLEFLPKGARDFQDVMRVNRIGEGVYFQTRDRVIRMTPEGDGWQSKVWRAPEPLRYSFSIRGTLYASTGNGLLRLKDEQFETVPLVALPNGRPAVITMMLALGDTGRILLGTNGGDLLLLDDAGVRPFANEAAGLLQRLQLYQGTVLPDGAVALATRGGGVVILETDGRLRRYLDRTSGIPSDGVNAEFVDRTGTLWLGLQNGIAKVETDSALSEFNGTAGASSAVNQLLRYRGALHAMTVRGLIRLDPATRSFRPVPGAETISVFGAAVFRDRLLLAASRDGVLEWDGRVMRPVGMSQDTGAKMMLSVSRQDPARVWITTEAGLASARWEEPGRWKDEGIVAALPTCRSLVEPEPGVLWLGTEARGVVRVRFNGDSIAKPQVEAFGKADGLPGEGGASVHWVAGRMVFASPAGVREFDEKSKRFVPSALFGQIPTGGAAEEYNTATDGKGNLWVNFGVRPVFLEKQSDGTYRMDANRLRRVADGRADWIWLDDDNVLWLGTNDRILRYDPAKVRSRGQAPSALLRRVTAGEKNKRVLYGGGGGGGNDALEVPYRDNEVRFEYALASFEDPLANQFQTKLEGFDGDWSAWSTETRRDYTNLPAGSYRFRVRARNLLMQESTEAGYAMAILPPWYRTWWAYGLYALLLAGIVVGADRIMRRRLIARERAAAESKALQAELERKRNVELLSEVGKEITASLDIDTIFGKLHANVNELMDASVFGVGIYHAREHSIEYRLAYENGKKYEPYRRDTRDKDQFPVWCIDHRKAVFINDVTAEYGKYISKYEEKWKKLEDGSMSQPPQSLIYLPLVVKERVLGIITVQSFRKNAYTEYQLNLLENLAAYTAIALDNADAYLSLKAAQNQLVTQEKLASLGALTAGIAHEIKNPLNFVNNFADLSVDLMDELREEMSKLRMGQAVDVDNVENLLDDLTGNAKKINEHGKRADGIVKSMLQHSRGQAGERQATDVNAMLEEYVNLAYHGMRAQDSSFNITIERDFGKDIGTVEAVPQDLSRVFLNLINNACYAANDKAKKAGPGFAPTLAVRTVKVGSSVEIRVRDNGMGIPEEIRDKIFHPFFTTKPTGQGTGLGLSISHDIVVQEHGGELEVETEPGKYTEFVVRLPVKGVAARAGLDGH